MRADFFDFYPVFKPLMPEITNRDCDRWTRPSVAE